MSSAQNAYSPSDMMIPEAMLVEWNVGKRIARPKVDLLRLLGLVVAFNPSVASHNWRRGCSKSVDIGQ